MNTHAGESDGGFAAVAGLKTFLFSRAVALLVNLSLLCYLLKDNRLQSDTLMRAGRNQRHQSPAVLSGGMGGKSGVESGNVADKAMDMSRREGRWPSGVTFWTHPSGKWI